jgi:peptide/nickel transport system substrate-binding protein
LDGVRISFIEDRNTAFLEFMTRGIDFFSGVQASFAAQLLTTSGALRSELKDKMGFVRANYLNTEYIGINFESLSQDHPLRSVQFRQALNFAIDREQMISLFRFGLGVPAVSGFIPPALLSETVAKPVCYSYDPTRAKELIKSSGYDLLSKEKKTIVVNTNKDYLDLVSFIVRQWQEIGVQVKIELMETATLREKMRNGSLNLFRASWIADYPDAESFMTVFYSKNPPPPNYTRFRDTVFDSLYLRAVVETDPLVRSELYVQMDQIICREAPVIFLLYDEIALFHQKNLTGITGNAINLLKLEGVGKRSDPTSGQKL